MSSPNEITVLESLPYCMLRPQPWLCPFKMEVLTIRAKQFWVSCGTTWGKSFAWLCQTGTELCRTWTHFPFVLHAFTTNPLACRVTSHLQGYSSMVLSFCSWQREVSPSPGWDDSHAAGDGTEKGWGMLGFADVMGSQQFSSRSGWLWAGREPQIRLQLRWGHPCCVGFFYLFFGGGCYFRKSVWTFKVSVLIPTPTQISMCRSPFPPLSLPSCTLSQHHHTQTLLSL